MEGDDKEDLEGETIEGALLVATPTNAWLEAFRGIGQNLELDDVDGVTES